MSLSAMNDGRHRDCPWIAEMKPDEMNECRDITYIRLDSNTRCVNTWINEKSPGTNLTLLNASVGWFMTEISDTTDAPPFLFRPGEKPKQCSI
jgi:hypothetical protein|uniref:Uncharacterized protein n=1 Tax=Picea glauca TaxID=3330 RepID=A0A101LZD8_PICGL|nr:hypothetical protein ABT39_MTgene5086 [Picea glauca]QHR87717.1 hypothetical protein Q903MT_gene1729 [Picea sitchensis]